MMDTDGLFIDELITSLKAIGCVEPRITIDARGDLEVNFRVEKGGYPATSSLKQAIQIFAVALALVKT